MHARNVLWMFGAAGGVCLVLCAATAHGKTFTVTNKAGRVVTLSDLYGGSKKGEHTNEYLKKGDDTDDVNIAANGQKWYEVGGDCYFTISWLNDAGDEVETDIHKRWYNIKESLLLAMFDSDFSDVYGIAFGAEQGALPDDGTEWLVQDGKITGDAGAYDWITFYDTTGSDGFIQYDEDGNAISPLLPFATVTTGHSYDVEVPEPGSLALLALGSLGVFKRRSIRHA